VFLAALVAFTRLMCFAAGLVATLTSLVDATAVVGAVAAAGVVVGAAVVVAKDAAATPVIRAAAIRVLIFNMVQTHS